MIWFLLRKSRQPWIIYDIFFKILYIFLLEAEFGINGLCLSSPLLPEILKNETLRNCHPNDITSELAFVYNSVKHACVPTMILICLEYPDEPYRFQILERPLIFKSNIRCHQICITPWFAHWPSLFNHDFDNFIISFHIQGKKVQFSFYWRSQQYFNPYWFYRTNILYLDIETWFLTINIICLMLTYLKL